MADIRHFKAYRPSKEYANQIAALPYDVYNRKEAKEIVQKNPLSFLGIDRAEAHFPDDYDMYSKEVYLKAKDLLNNFIESGKFIQDESPCYYLYEETMNGRSQTGLVAVSSIDDYLNNIIKKHENTRAEKELDRINHVDICNMQTGPIFLAYRKNKDLQECINIVKQTDCVYDFVSEDEVGHRVWVISDVDLVDRITKAFKSISQIYIADGHHRCASAVKVGLKRREENPNYTGEEDFNYFLSVLFCDEELKIMDYNRVVKDLAGYTKEEFINKVSQVFEVELIGKEQYKPIKKGEFGMYLDDNWYKLTAKSCLLSTDPVKNLDVSILQDNLLKPILKIDDPKTDERIDFVGGIRGLSELEKRVHLDMRIAFSMYPTSINELFEVADASKLMPPKSTWFEPKLRSGLFLHKI